MSPFFDMASRALPLLANGALMTLQISVAGVAMGLCIGMILGVTNCNRLRNKLLGSLIDIYVAVLRGTPLFVQLLFIYFAIPAAFHVDMAPVTAGVLTLGLNSGAYLSEIIRGGINSIAPGQWEAAFTLGYSTKQTLQHIVLPQALRNALPSVTNELVTLVKDSSIMMIIGVPELIKVGRDIVARELNPIEIYTLVAAFYFVITMVIGLIGKKLERRLA
jgi:His/Glu/Gln/Arg/opine family amino acid ABC transporter permease subunit